MASHGAMKESLKSAGPKVMHHMEIHPAMGGGHLIQSHFHGPHEMESHEFKAGEGAAMMDHIKTRMGVSENLGGSDDE